MIDLDLSALDDLKRSLRNRILRKAVGKGARVMARAVKALAPRRTGALRTSIGTKVKVYEEVVVGIVGAKSNYYRKGIRPSKYAKLVELGTRHAAAHPYLKPALESTSADYQQTVIDTINEEVDKL